MRPLLPFIVLVSIPFGCRMDASASSAPSDVEPPELAALESVASQPVAPPEPAPLTTCPATLPELYASDERAKGTLVVVWKSLYLLGLYRDGRIVEDSNATICFPIAMGLKPWGPKTLMDGVSTPEGWYRAATKQDVGSTAFYRGFMLSYPNRGDVERAAETGVIDARLKSRLLADIAAGRTPPQSTPMGGEIMIHGMGSATPVWTAGCVAIENEHMDVLFRHVRRGDDILVTPWTERYALDPIGQLVVTSVPLPEGDDSMLTIPWNQGRVEWRPGVTLADFRLNAETGEVSLTLR